MVINTPDSQIGKQSLIIFLAPNFSSSKHFKRVFSVGLSEPISSKELNNEIVYFAQIRVNNQITIPKECMEAKALKQGDVIAIAVLKIVDGTVTWTNLKARLGGE